MHVTARSDTEPEAEQSDEQSCEWDPEEADDQETTAGGDLPPEHEDQQGYKGTYLAIDGVAPSEFSEEDRELLRKRVIDTVLLDLNKSVEEVRFIDENVSIIELHPDS